MLAAILALYMTNSAPGAVPAKLLTSEIIRIAHKYEQDPELITRIILLESKGLAGAMNEKTHDYGIMQINIKTAASMKLNTACLFDWRCNLEAGVKILSKVNRVCRYNVGTASLTGTRLNNCLTYELKLASIE